MNKRIALSIFISVSVLLTGCGSKQVENPSATNTQNNKDTIIINQTAQKKANEIKNSAVPNFAEIYNNTVEIDVNFDTKGMYSNKAIEIKDGKMLSDILTMIGKSQLITDESKIKNMSGMATKSNNFTLVRRDGSKRKSNLLLMIPHLQLGI